MERLGGSPLRKDGLLQIHACQTSSWTFSASPDTGEHTKCTAHCWACILIIHPKWTLPCIIQLCETTEEHPPPSSFSIQILFSDLASTLMRLPSLSGPGFPPCEMNWTQDTVNLRNHFMQNPLLVYHHVWWSLGKTRSWLVPVLEGIR